MGDRFAVRVDPTGAVVEARVGWWRWLMVGVGVVVHYWSVGRGEGGGEQAGDCQDEEEEEHDGSGRVTLSFQDPL